MGNIVLLDDLTINKIAAGEVIERPASVVKEMVENSIDAGAKNITIEIKNGGISLIKITDDGCGIAEDDMEIAFERHATSKIRKAEDLELVRTMGFRGEALASIAAIAKVQMVSRKENSDVAHKIIVEGGKTLDFFETARNVGTTITVENLFYNTPVRYKFLKKDYTEAGYIEDVVTRIALVNKNVAIKLISNGKPVIQTNGNGDLKTIIYSIYGKDIASEIIEIDYQYEDIKIKGAIGKPVIARGNRSNQLFFLNGRYIKDKSISSAADQAYKGMIPVGRYGFVVLNIEMDPKYVDVNVHPAKLEVRFEDESKVFKAVYHAIKSNLAQNEFGLKDNEKEEILEQKELSSKVNDILSKYKNKNLMSKDELEINDNFIPKAENKAKIENIIKNYKNNLEEKAEEEIKKASEDISNIETVECNTENVIQNSETKIEETVEENTVDEDIEDNFSKDNTEKKGGIAGIFRKFMKEPEETQDEINNNYLNDIFKFRQSLKDEDSNEEKNNFSYNTDNAEKSTSDNLEENNTENVSDIDTNKTINDNELYKNVSLGNTLISSDTKELNVNVVNNLVKNMVTESSINNMQETQIVDVPNNTIEETQKIDLNKTKSTDQNTIVAPKEELSALPQQTVVLEENIKKIDNEPEKNTFENSVNSIENNSNNEFAKVAEKLVEKKLEFEGTQTIDTSKVRDAIKDEKFENNPEFDKMYKKTFGIDPFAVRKEKQLEEIEKQKTNVSNDFSYVSENENENVNVFEEESQIIPHKFLGIAFSNYAIVEIKNEIYIIDEYAAQEKILFENIKNKFYSDKKQDQFLLMPDIIDLNHKQMIILKENVEMLNKAGFLFEDFGENTIKLNSVPAICENLNTKQLFIDILTALDKVAVTENKEKEEKFIATVAEKVALETRVNLDENEMQSLINDLLKIPNPFTSSNNKPIAMKMTKYDLERKFSRR